MNGPPAVRPGVPAPPVPSEERLAEAFAEWQDELLGMLCCLLGNAADAQDALQDAFVKCWRHLEKADDVVNLRAWVFRVTLNAGKDLRSAAWRRKRRALDDWADTLPAPDDGPEADAQRRERLLLVRRALTALRSEEQEVFLLRQNGELTYDEISRLLGIPTGTVKTRMRLALEKLRAALETTDA